MEHFRLRKYRSPETWARAREAYVAGETGPSVARRFDVGLANLRKKAREEGWDRRSVAAILEKELPRRKAEVPPNGEAKSEVKSEVRGETRPEIRAEDPFDLAEAADTALRQAALAVQEGRSSEAQGLIRVAEGFQRMVGVDPATGERAPTPQEIEAKQAEEAAMRERVADRLTRMVEHMAHQMLMERPVGVPVLYAPFVYAFRARHFGPEVEAADRAHALAEGWSQHIWDEDGRLKAGSIAEASGRTPPSTEPPSDAAASYPCCAWMETAEADIRAGREPDYGQEREAD